MPIIDRRGAAIVSMIVVVLALAVAIPPFIAATGDDASKTFTQTEGEDLQLTGTLFADLTNVRDGQSFTEVASIHTTDTDFNGADTLDNVTVEGSGDSAYVELSDPTIEGFESGDISSYGGDTGAFTVVTSPVFEGSNSLKGDFGTVESMADTDVQISQGDTISYRHYLSESDTTSGILLGAQGEVSDGSQSGYYIEVRDDTDEIRIYRQDSGSFTQLGSTSAGTVPLDQWLNVTAEWTNGGGISVTLDNSAGTELATLSVTDGTYTSGGLGFRGSSGVAHYDEVVFLSGGGGQGRYISSTHSVNGAETGFTNVTLTNAEAVITWEADTDGDGSFETEVTSDTRTSTGNYTADLSGTSGQNFRVNVTFSSTSDGFTARLNDEGVLTTTTEGTDVNVTLVDTETGQTVDTGQINESETRQFTIGMETVTVTNEDVLSGNRSLMTYEYPAYYGMDGGVKTLVSNAPLIALALGFIIVVMALYAGRGV